MSGAHHWIIRKIGISNFAYQLVGGCFQLNYRLAELGKGDPLLVYQMGKVGSRTIVETLKTLPINRPIFHVHFLTQAGLAFDREKADSLGRAYPGKSYWTGMYLQKYLKGDSGKELDIIVLTRDPVSRNLSAFFHSMDYWFPELREITEKKTYTNDDFSRIRRVFLDRYHHRKALEWFESELDEVFDINVYQNDFPSSQGFQILGNPPIRVLILKLERLNGVIRPALEEFLDLELADLEMVPANLSEERSYIKIYRQFLSWLTLPEEYLDSMYRSKYAAHFYSPDEISEFRSRWLKK